MHSFDPSLQQATSMMNTSAAPMMPDNGSGGSNLAGDSQVDARTLQLQRTEQIWAYVLDCLRQGYMPVKIPIDMFHVSGAEIIQSDIKNRFSAWHGGSPAQVSVDFSMHGDIFWAIGVTLEPPQLEHLSLPNLSHPWDNLNAISPRMQPAVPESASVSGVAFRSKSRVSKATKARIPRPRNEWIIYRQEKHPILTAQHPDVKNTDLSKMIGVLWQGEDPATKAHYRLLAQQEREQHKIKYPDYVYNPRNSSDKKRRQRKETTRAKNTQNKVMMHSDHEVAAGMATSGVFTGNAAAVVDEFAQISSAQTLDNDLPSLKTPETYEFDFNLFGPINSDQVSSEAPILSNENIWALYEGVSKL